jgi:hypothetical protein
MLLLWACAPLLLFATLANALQSDRQLRRRLGTGFGHTNHRKRSLGDTAFTVEVLRTYHYDPLPAFLILEIAFTLPS